MERQPTNLALLARHVIFSVEDSGPGIPESEQPKVFDRYQSRSESKQGIGLGLFISKAIVDAHGGQIALEDGVPDHTTFAVTLPR